MRPRISRARRNKLASLNALTVIPLCVSPITLSQLSRLQYVPDTKLVNAGTFKIEREDHTIGNLLRMQLMEDKDVVFVGYKQPHPLEHHILLKVQTSSNPSPGTKNPYLPVDALQNALKDLSAEVAILTEKLNSDIQANGM